LTRDGDDKSYFFTGSKYLKYISSMRIMNNNQTILLRIRKWSINKTVELNTWEKGAKKRVNPS
jgi:hypothetical protein